MRPRKDHLQLQFQTKAVINRTLNVGLLTICFFSCNFVIACGPGRGSYERRDYPDFVKDQREPDVNEENAIASGSFIKQITRSSPEFKKELVRSFDTDIVFKDDEKTGADRYMTRVSVLFSFNLYIRFHIDSNYGIIMLLNKNGFMV